MNPSHDLQGLKKKAKETFLYVLSALLLGIAIGAIDAVFGRVLLFITDFRSAHVVVLLPFLPLAGLGIVWLYRHFNETASKGMTLVMEAGQGKRESIPLALIPLVMAGTWITHLFGGSAGREGVAVLHALQHNAKTFQPVIFRLLNRQLLCQCRQFIPDLIIGCPHHIRRAADPVFYFQMRIQKIPFLCIMDRNFPQLSKPLR